MGMLSKRAAPADHGHAPARLAKRKTLAAYRRRHCPLPTKPVQLSARDARQLALAAQGFGAARPKGAVTQRHLQQLFDRVGVIQIDSVNVLVRSQELPVFARLGPHNRSLLPRAVESGALFEYWAHAAALVPTKHQHLFRWRMEQGRSPSMGGPLTRMHRGKKTYVDFVHQYIVENGPVVAGDLSQRTTPKGKWWDWDAAKLALEYLFLVGRLSARRQANNFARVYDLPERILPASVLAAPTPSPHAAQTQLITLAAHSMGVATASDLADYYRQKLTPVKPIIAELVEAGTLLPATVEGWKEPAYLHCAAAPIKQVEACALLSPFDSLVWNRQRSERLFNFRYRIEIYTPQPQRKFGYYVLPFLLGDTLVGRMDLKADRATGALRVQAAHLEPGCKAGSAAAQLAHLLPEMAAWLGLGRVIVAARGNLAHALRQAL